jgi:hypothetical protein
MKNVHEFDGKLPQVHLPQIPNKNEIINDFLSRDLNLKVKKCVTIIQNQINKSSDIDGKNNNYLASDLLVLAILNIPTHILCEQLEVIMDKGRCIQGQVIRLFQLLYSFGKFDDRETLSRE